MVFDPLYLLCTVPFLLLGMLAQFWVKSAYQRGMQQGASLSGAAAARHILDSAGLQNVPIEAVGGQLTDHYDPRKRVLRLSQAVYQSRTLAAVGIAAHEAGHAIQHARAYAPLVIRNAAVPLAGFGSNAGILVFLVGLSVASLSFLMVVGIGLFVCVVFFQVVNLPVEFNASSRAKSELARLRIVDAEGMVWVNRVLRAAAMTYVAKTLQTVMTLLYLVMRARSRR